MLSTHVLDTSTGRPGERIPVELVRIDGDARTPVASAVTDADGRTAAPLGDALAPGIYELVFSVAPYFAARNVPSFYDRIAVRFRIDDARAKYHVPLLVAPWGYSTYRGS